MAWTAPMTAVQNATWTAAEFNAHVRDNLLETMAGKATTGSRIMISTGANAIAERAPTSATVATAETTASPTYAALATPGPSVTVTTGTSAIVIFTAQHDNSTSTAQNWTAIDVSGATTIAASDEISILTDGLAAGDDARFQKSYMFTTLNAGSNTFTLQYRCSAATATFSNRHLLVIPL